MATTRFIDHLLTGDHASRPAFGDVPEGTLYSCTDHNLIYQSDGATAWATYADMTTGDVTYGTPSLTLGTANAIGATSEAIRRDATILAFDATVPSTQAFSDSAATGSATVAARRDHKHAMPATPDLSGLIPFSTIDGKGELIVGTANDALDNLPAAGTAGHVLTADSTQTMGVKWAAASTGPGVAADTIWAAKGDLAVGTANDSAAVLGVGTTGYVLMADSAQALGVKWAPPTAGTSAVIATDPIWAAKGDIAAGTANDAAAVLTVGANDTVLTADSAMATGLKWATPSGGGGGLQRHQVGTTPDRWYAAGIVSGFSMSSVGITNNRLCAFPFVPSKNMTIDGMACLLNGTATGNVRLGIYSDDGNLYPNARLGQSASQSTNVANVVKDTSSFSVALTAGTLYWFALVTNSSASFRIPTVDALVPILGVLSSSLSYTAGAGYGWDASHTFGSLPDPYPASANIVTSASVTSPLIYARGV